MKAPVINIFIGPFSQGRGDRSSRTSQRRYGVRLRLNNHHIPLGSIPLAKKRHYKEKNA